jgi:hypothetical protein
MNNELITGSSEFSGLADIEYFNFEEDFVRENIRCIPMIVRFKMDRAGIKLRLAEWNKFSVEERIELARKSCTDKSEELEYNLYLSGLVKKYTGKEASPLLIDENPAWAATGKVPEILNEKLKDVCLDLSEEQWKRLTNLQRFALLKLCKEEHENKNFPKAINEFRLGN